MRLWMDQSARLVETERPEVILHNKRQSCVWLCESQYEVVSNE